MERLGIFIVLEGIDGSGKGTQFHLLAERLQAEGYDVALFDFPQYDAPSSYFVQKYLNGQYGAVEDIGPYTGSLFYALDRFDAAQKIRIALKQGKVVLANRFTGSNMAHQGTKFRESHERRGYFIWLDNLEFEMLKIPRPDMNIVLRVPAAIAQKLVDQKKQRSYTANKRDLHEADLSHLERAVEVYDDLCQLFPKDFSQIDCVQDGRLQNIDAVSELIRQKIAPILPKLPIPPLTSGLSGQQQGPKLSIATKATGTDVNDRVTQGSNMPQSAEAAENPYITKTGDSYTITKDGERYLDYAVTNRTGNVYGFSDSLSPVTIAAAMARLSRRGDDMRLTILDEFAKAGGKDEQLLHRVITAYGDDSVQQLVGLHMVVEDASNLLTKKLEWGRLASYLEQSTRYIYFDRKDVHGHYKYYTPEHFDAAVTKDYRKGMDAIFDRYSQLVRRLTDYVRHHSDTPASQRDVAWNGATRAQACDVARAVLPVATKSTVGIFASGQALESLIMHLLADELPEARATGQKLLEEGRKVIPAFLERADKPDRGGAMVAYQATTKQNVHKLAEQLLPNFHAVAQNVDADLIDVWPRNELDLVPDMLYEHSDLPLRELQSGTNNWSYDQKVTVFSAYMGERLNRRHRPGRALEKAHYSWDIVCDYGIFRDLQRHRMVDDLEWQTLTPRLGFDIPKLVETAGLTNLYQECFDISLRLHSFLQQSGYSLEAQYATLLGHNMRWKVTYNAREAFHIHELRTSPQGHPGYRNLILRMHDKIREVHPLLADAMHFVNQGEDAKLTRLAAERYTQSKLHQIAKT